MITTLYFKGLISYILAIVSPQVYICVDLCTKNQLKCAALPQPEFSLLPRTQINTVPCLCCAIVTRILFPPKNTALFYV